MGRQNGLFSGTDLRVWCIHSDLPTSFHFFTSHCAAFIFPELLNFQLVHRVQRGLLMRRRGRRGRRRPFLRKSRAILMKQRRLFFQRLSRPQIHILGCLLRARLPGRPGPPPATAAASAASVNASSALVAKRIEFYGPILHVSRQVFRLKNLWSLSRGREKKKCGRLLTLP